VQGSCPGCQVDHFDISQEGGCPDFDVIKTYDAVIVGTPSWNGAPPGDMIDFMNLWPLDDTGLRCKIGGAFSTGGGYYSGIQPVLETIHRALMTFQMIIVGGPDWNTGEGAAAVTGIWPFYTYADNDTSDEYVGINPLFMADGRAFGARIGNITQAMQAVPPLCGNYPGQEEAHRR
jgi:multimeric flavodoxin WrbA